MEHEEKVRQFPNDATISYATKVFAARDIQATTILFILQEIEWVRHDDYETIIQGFDSIDMGYLQDKTCSRHFQIVGLHSHYNMLNYCRLSPILKLVVYLPSTITLLTKTNICLFMHDTRKSLELV